MHTARVLTVSPSMLCTGGVSALVYLLPGDVCSWGVYLVPEGCLLPGGVPGPRVVCSWGVYLVLGGVTGSRGCLLLGGCLLPGACQVLPPCEQNDKQVQKILPCPKLRLRAVIMTGRHNHRRKPVIALFLRKMYWQFIHASKYIFSQTAIVKHSQNLLNFLHDAHLTDVRNVIFRNDLNVNFMGKGH